MNRISPRSVYVRVAMATAVASGALLASSAAGHAAAVPAKDGSSSADRYLNARQSFSSDDPTQPILKDGAGEPSGVTGPGDPTQPTPKDGGSQPSPDTTPSDPTQPTPKDGGAV